MPVTNLAALPCGEYRGRKFYRVPVRVLLNNSHRCTTEAIRLHWVIAPSAKDAANYVRDEYATRAETNIEAYGPRGGIVQRYIGWESAIAAAMWDPRVRAARDMTASQLDWCRV